MVLTVKGFTGNDLQQRSRGEPRICQLYSEVCLAYRAGQCCRKHSGGRMLLTASHIYSKAQEGVAGALSFSVIKEITLRSLLSLVREFVNQPCYQWDPLLCSVELAHCKDLRKWRPSGYSLVIGSQGLSFLKKTCLDSGSAVINFSHWVITSGTSILKILPVSCSSGAQL